MEPAASSIVELFRDLHREVRKEVEQLDAAALNWTPAPETSPIGTLVVHLLGSELETFRFVRGLGSDRDRSSEFVQQAHDPNDLLERLARADLALDEHGPGITAADLSEIRTNPRRGPNTGLYWLASNYGHAKEHLAHLQLTRQLLQQARSSS